MSQAFDHSLDTSAQPQVVSVARTHVEVERRSTEPLKQLGRYMNQVCISAVDPLQIAAALEADGMNDDIASARYSAANIFELAEHLYRDVPLRLVQPSSPFSPQRRWREMSHGLLFALPGLFYPEVFSLTNSTTATLYLALSVIAGWAWSQVMVRLAYLLIGRGAAPEAAQWLRLAALLGISGVSVVALFATLNAASSGVPALLAVGQMAYQMAAAILLFYEREEWLFAALVPGVVASLLFLLTPVLSATVATAAISLSLLLSLAAALRAARVDTPVIAARLGITARDLSDALPFLIYGTLCALFVSFDTLRFWQSIGAAGLGLTIAPLVLSMGVLEWQLRRFREHVAVSLARTHSARVFADGVWSLFLGALTRYAGLLAALSAALWVLLIPGSGDAFRVGVLLLANWVLGCAFFIGFALISQERIGLVIIYLSVALSIHVLDVRLLIPFARVQDYTSSYLFSSLIFAILLMVIAKPILSEIRNYRYDLEVTRYGQ